MDPIFLKDAPTVPASTRVKTTVSQLPAGQQSVYVVHSGDNLGAIAQRFGVTIHNLKMWNNLYSDRIYVGQKLVVYTSRSPLITSPTVVSSAKPTPSTPTKNVVTTTTGKTYTVVSGDNLWDIARKYQTTVEAIKKLNSLDSGKLYPGKQLLIP